MKARKEWIDDVMNSFDGIQKAPANPFLAEKILNRMQQASPVANVFSRKVIMRLAIGFTILLIINLVSIKQYSAGRKTSTSSVFFSEYDFSYNYNY